MSNFKVNGFKFIKALSGKGGFGLPYLFQSEKDPSQQYFVKHIHYEGLFNKLQLEAGLDAGEAEKKANDLIAKELNILELLKKEEEKSKNQRWNFPMFHFS